MEKIAEECFDPNPKDEKNPYTNLFFIEIFRVKYGFLGCFEKVKIWFLSSNSFKKGPMAVLTRGKKTYNRCGSSP